MPPRAPSSSSPRKTKGISTSGAKAPSKAPRAAASAAKSTAPKSAAAKPTATPAPRARKAGATDSSATRRIAEAITTAIVERRLMPGTKLAEQKLADVFKVSRTLVRQALNQLSRDKLVTLTPARGAFVAQPSVEEARQVFAVRNMIELSMARELAAVITPQQVAELRTHLKDERAAVQRTDVPGRTRLLADFHVVLARMLGNQVLAEIVSDLVSRSSLISLMYQSAHSAEHSYAEHVVIVDALERGDPEPAAALMEEHLHNVERNLRLSPRIPDLDQLSAALMPAAPASSLEAHEP